MLLLVTELMSVLVVEKGHLFLAVMVIRYYVCGVCGAVNMLNNSGFLLIYSLNNRAGVNVSNLR